MHPSLHARNTPQKKAVIVAETGESWSYSSLDSRSNQVAHLFRSYGLNTGDTVAIFMENRLDYFGFVWGAQRAGLFYVCISAKLTPSEVAYIIEDSGARLIIASVELGKVAAALVPRVGNVIRLMTGGVQEGWRPIERELDSQPVTPIEDERAGIDMLYSSGTTGSPKAVRVGLPENPDLLAPTQRAALAQKMYGFDSDTVYLSPAPLYHAAALRWAMSAMHLGGTVVIMKAFDALMTLKAIETYQVTIAQFVPTHFIRMLKLSIEDRRRYSTASLKVAVHAAAPCPIPVKEAMIDWWGPIIHEYYGGSEGNGLTTINSYQWLTHKGSVGRAVKGVVHICDDRGEELPVGSEGLVFFADGGTFEYLNDPEKTNEVSNVRGWTTLGDVGKLNDEGFLYLTDRKSFMIISGGVNIYPQEIENRIITHPKVADVAVIGAPEPEMGEKVVALVQPVDMTCAGPELVEELINWCRSELSGYKIPRQIDFVDELPRLPTGKLLKRVLRDRYWPQSDLGHLNGKTPEPEKQSD